MAKKAYVYNGSAWEDLASSISDLSSYATTVDLDNYQLKSVAGLTLVKSQVIGTAVSSVNVTSAFSATYDNYKIVISGGVASGGFLMGLKLGVTATGYYYGQAITTYANTSGSVGQANQASFPRIGVGTTDVLTANFELQNPFNAKLTILTYFNTDPRTNGEGGAGAGVLNNTTSYTDFTITPSGGTYTGGTIRVYGYQN